MQWRLLPGLCAICHFLCLAKAMKNAVIGVRTKCDQDEMRVSLLFEEDFQGVVYSRGLSRECNVTGDLTNQVTLSLHPANCSLRVHKEEDKLIYSTVIQVQMSPTLQQVNDPSFPVSCNLKLDMLNINSKQIKHLHNNRTGRGMSKPARAWMEVKGSAISGFSNSLTVGEHTTLAIYTSLPDGVVGQPVECLVHDGQGTKQALSDRHGCSVDPGLVPRLRYNSRAHTWITAFPAFSFPDSPLVHYVCKLMLCNGHCPEVDCVTDKNASRISRDIVEDDKVTIIDIVELYNSVEVTAPNIEVGYLKKELEDIVEGSRDGAEGKSLCMSAPRVAVVFAMLGGVFLSATLAALCFMLRKKRSYLRHAGSDFHILRPPSPASLWSLRL